MKLLRNAALSALLLFTVTGCPSTGDIIRADYVAADRATYEAIGPRYREYVNADPDLDNEEKRRRNRTVDTWNLRLDQAETPVQPEGE
jgi:hypothetical protein